MNEKNYRAHLAILTANLIFGLNTPISKIVLQKYLTPNSLTSLRMLGAALLFWVISLFFQKEKVSKKDLPFIFLASLFGILINQFSFIKGLSLTSPVNAGIIISSTPLITMFLSAFFLKEPITGKKITGVLIGASGAVLLLMSSHLRHAAGDSYILGDILCLTSCLSYAIYLTAFRWLLNKYKPVTLMKWMFLFAGTLSATFAYNDLGHIAFSEIPISGYLQIAYVIVGATFLTYLLIPIAQKSLRPTTLSMYNYLQPLVTTLVAVIIGLDVFGVTKTVAALLIFTGVLVVMKSKSKAQLDKEKSEKMGDNLKE